MTRARITEHITAAAGIATLVGLWVLVMGLPC